MRDVSAASELLKPFDARLMRSYPVSSRVNSVANDDEARSAPVFINTDAEKSNRLYGFFMSEVMEQRSSSLSSLWWVFRSCYIACGISCLR